MSAREGTALVILHNIFCESADVQWMLPESVLTDGAGRAAPPQCALTLVALTGF